MLQAVVQSYFGINDMQDGIAGKQANMVKNPYMSFGTFSTNVQGAYNRGVLRHAKLSGMMMDIDRISAISVESNNNIENWVTFNTSQGVRMSVNEHLVPEQFFNDPNLITKNVNGISAVKAIQIAASQGQKIYSIDKTNISTVLPQLNHDSGTIQDIQNAVAAGKIVTTSQTKVSVNNWTGSGYIIQDTTTGAGAYMISGGTNGGAITMPPAYSIFFAIAAIAFIAGLFVAGTVLAIALLIVAILMLGCGLANYTQDGIYGDWAAWGVGGVLGFLGLIATSGAGIAYVIGLIASASLVATRFSSRCVEA